VSEDGAVIRSDPGVGVIKAGWHCGGNPNTVGSAGTCPACQKCQGTQCVTDAAKNGQSPVDDKCTTCNNGTPTPITVNPITVKTSLTFGLPAPAVDKVNKGLEKLKVFGILAEVHLLQITGEVAETECCGKTVGLAKKKEGEVSGNFGSFAFKVKVWPLGPIPDWEEEFGIGFVTVTAHAQFVGGVFVGLSGDVEGKIGYRKDACSADPADSAGCFFAGLNSTLTLKASAEAGGDVGITFGGDDCDDCTDISVAGRLAAEASFPFDISNVDYNDDSCSAGLQGGTVEWDDAEFKVFASLSGKLRVLGADIELERTWEFLTCTANLTEGVECHVGG